MAIYSIAVEYKGLDDCGKLVGARYNALRGGVSNAVGFGEREAWTHALALLARVRARKLGKPLCDKRGRSRVTVRHVTGT